MGGKKPSVRKGPGSENEKPRVERGGELKKKPLAKQITIDLDM